MAGRTRPQESRSERRRKTRAAGPAPPAPAPRRERVPAGVKLGLATAAVLLFYLAMRVAASHPWSYDEYYHLGLAREMRADFRIESFRWTPFSVLFDGFADMEPLFHLLLMPLAGLPFEWAGLLGVALGQLFVFGTFALALWALRVPYAHGFVLALAALGPLFALRADMCRPHLLLVGFSVLVLALLAGEASWKALVPVCALFALAHAGAWIAVGYAALWGVAGLLSRRPTERRLAWRPAAAAAAGWLLAHLLHPNLPHNFRLLWLTNVVIPFQSQAGGAALRSQLGTELEAPGLPLLLLQWPAFAAPLALAAALLFAPRLRTRATLTAGLAALAFFVAGSFFVRRFFELGAPLAVFALALALRERGPTGRRLWKGWPAILALFILAGASWTVRVVRAQGFGMASPPREMARWLGEHGRPGERVFTAQWADSAPLFYSAPQLQSLFILDPTSFWIDDPRRFATYVRIVQGQHGDPVRAIREQFGARWITLWKRPAYQRLATQLGRVPGMRIAYDDPFYLVLDLAPLGAQSGSRR